MSCQKRNWCVLVYVLAVLFICTGTVSPAPKKPATTAEVMLYKGTDRQQILEQGAKKEGKLTFYTGGILKQAVRPVVDAFEKKYPFIKVEIWRVSSDEMLARATEEFKSGNHLFDVMEGTQDKMLVIHKLGIVQPFHSPNLSQIEDEAKTYAPGGGVIAAAFRSSGTGLGYNTKLITKGELPKSYQDLLDPKWRGKLPLAGSDTGVNWAGCIRDHFGEEFLKKLARQDFIVHMVSGSALLDMIIAGEYALSPTIYDSHVFGSSKSGSPVAWVPLEPVRVNVGQIAVAKYAPHPHAALLFADFELSKESGEIHRSVGYGPFRKDVAPLAQPYKKYFGRNTMAELAEEHELFGRLFMKK